MKPAGSSAWSVRPHRSRWAPVPRPHPRGCEPGALPLVAVECAGAPEASALRAACRARVPPRAQPCPGMAPAPGREQGCGVVPGAAPSPGFARRGGACGCSRPRGAAAPRQGGPWFWGRGAAVCGHGWRRGGFCGCVRSTGTKLSPRRRGSARCPQRPSCPLPTCAAATRAWPGRGCGRVGDVARSGGSLALACAAPGAFPALPAVCRCSPSRDARPAAAPPARHRAGSAGATRDPAGAGAAPCNAWGPWGLPGSSRTVPGAAERADPPAAAGWGARAGRGRWQQQQLRRPLIVWRVGN